MASLSGIHCRCGRRIRSRDVLQRGYYLSNWEPIYVYLKYRCANCKMLGEQMVAYRDWDDAFLDDGEQAPPASRDRARQAELGPITVAEVRQFARCMARLRRADVERLRQATT